MNKIFLSGRLTRDPEIRRSEAGKTVFLFSLAVTRAMYMPDKQNTDFFDCVAFGLTAEQMQKTDLHKGSKILVEGETRIESYTNRNGEKKIKTQVAVFRYELLDSRKNPAQIVKETAQSFDDLGLADDDDDIDVPFL